MSLLADRTVTTMRRCPVCGGDSGEVLHTQAFRVPEQHPLSAGYRVVVCASCGLGFADSAATAADYERFYARFNKYAEFTFEPAPTSAPAVPPWDADRLERTAQLLVDRLGPDVGVLDVGCGSGHLLRALSARAVTRLVGLDPSPRSARLVETIPGARGLVGPLSTPPVEATAAVAAADVVTLCHVLEHVWDLDAAMAGLLAMVRPGGVVYAEVPDGRRYAELLLAPYHDFNTEHVTYFSGALLQRLFERWGFERLDGDDVTIDCGPDLPFPATWGLFRRLPAGSLRLSAPAEEPRRDDELGPALRDYVQRSAALLDTFAARLDEALAGARSVAVWGVGELTMKLLTLPVLADPDRVLILVDGSPGKQGLSLVGHRVEAPEVLAGTDGPVLVSSVHHAASIVRAAGRLGIDPSRLVLLPGASI
jgi:SAM-dependent methyltransferase